MTHPSSGWTAGAVKPPTSEGLQEALRRLEVKFSAAADHRTTLQELGSQMVHTQRCEVNGLKDCHWSLVRFSGAIELAFGLTREVLFFYSPYPDLQIREFEAAKAAIKLARRDITPDIVFFWSADPRARQKLDDWSQGGKILAIPLGSVTSGDPVSLISLLRDYIFARDLFYESSPVRGDKFFGRRQVLRSLQDDVASQRVAGVFGLRKAGKTSVLAQLAENLQDGERIVILRDLESLPSPPQDPTPGLIKDLVTDFIDQLNPVGDDLAALRSLLATPDLSDFRRTIQSQLRKLAQSGRSVVLMLDEIEYLTPSDRIDIAEGNLPSISQMLGALRSLVQENPNFTFILSGLTSAIVEGGRLYGRPNPLFSWAKSHFLSPFDRDEADELAQSLGGRMGIHIEEGALQALFEATGGHAFLYRHLASTVVQTLPVDVFQRRVTRRDVLASLSAWKRLVAGNITEMVSHVKRYYPIEGILLDALQEDPTEFGALADEFPLALQHLLSLGLIQEDGSSYEPTTILSLV